MDSNIMHFLKSLVLGMLVVQAWSQEPILTITGFEPVCPIDGVDKVIMRGEVDMTGVNTSVWSVRVAMVNSVTNNEIGVTILNSRCDTDQGEFTCEKQAGTDKYSVTYERAADKSQSKDDIFLRMQDSSSNIKTSPSVPYPFVKDTISESINVNGLNVTSDHKLDGENIRITYNVDGLELPFTVSILDASDNVIDSSTTQSQVSAVVNCSTTTKISLRYEMSGSCNKTTEISCKPSGPECECEVDCILAPVFTLVLLLDAAVVCFLIYRCSGECSGSGKVSKVIGIVTVACVVVSAVFIGRCYNASDNDCDCEWVLYVIIIAGVAILGIVAFCIFLCLKSQDVIWIAISSGVTLAHVNEQAKSQPKVMKKTQGTTLTRCQFVDQQNKPLGDDRALKALKEVAGSNGQGKARMRFNVHNQTLSLVLLDSQVVATGESVDLQEKNGSGDPTTKGYPEKDYKDSAGRDNHNRVSPKDDQGK